MHRMHHGVSNFGGTQAAWVGPFKQQAQLLRLLTLRRIPMSILSYVFAPLRVLFSGFTNARRYEVLFAMSDAELSARGFDRENLVRGFISGFAYR